MLPDRVSNPGPLTYESGALLIALRGPAVHFHDCSAKFTQGNHFCDFPFTSDEEALPERV